MLIIPIKSIQQCLKEIYGHEKLIKIDISPRDPLALAVGSINNNYTAIYLLDLINIKVIKFKVEYGIVLSVRFNGFGKYEGGKLLSTDSKLGTYFSGYLDDFLMNIDNSQEVITEDKDLDYSCLINSILNKLTLNSYLCEVEMNSSLGISNELSEIQAMCIKLNQDINQLFKVLCKICNEEPISNTIMCITKDTND